jgi:aspartate carbamoyltransferase catalytic subunit
MPIQTEIQFDNQGIKNVDWKLIARIQDERKKESEVIRLKQRAGAYHSLYLQAQKEIKVLKNQLINLQTDK